MAEPAGRQTAEPQAKPVERSSARAGPYRAVGRELLVPAWAMFVAPSNDAHEVAAAARAREVLAPTEPPGAIRFGLSRAQLPTEAPDVIAGSGGSIFGGAARRRFELGFGFGFGEVRIHDDALAATLAESVDARGFTYGSHIFFNQGEYRPGTPRGDALIAHELAHIEQGHSALSVTWRQSKTATVDPPAESAPQRLARQRQTALESFTQVVVETDSAGYAGVVLTVRRTDRELIPGFEKQDPKRPRPSGTTWRSWTEVAAELSPILDIMLLQAPADWTVTYVRDDAGRLRQTRFSQQPSPIPMVAPATALASPTASAATVTAMTADVDRLVKIQDDASYFSEGDSKATMEIVYRWAFEPNPPGFTAKGSYYLEEVFTRLAAKKTSSSDHYQALFDRFPTQQLRELRELRNAFAPARSTSADLQDKWDGVSYELAKLAPAAAAVTTTLPLSSDQKRVFGWLQTNATTVAAAEAKFLVDRRAIAGAIAWEALENPRSLTPSSVGLGKIHIRNVLNSGPFVTEFAEAGGYLPSQSDGDRKKLLATTSGAIGYIAAIMQQAADIAFEEGGYEISKDPPILCNYYQSPFWKTWRTRIAGKAVGDKLGDGESMGRWVRVHLQFLEAAVGAPSFAQSHPKPPKAFKSAASESSEMLTGPDHVRAVAGPALPLPADTRALMERQFGRDLSDVRLHTDSDAAAVARSLGAHAYTVGADIVFGSGKFRPDVTDGQRLIAHELTHVLQQRGGTTPKPGSTVLVGADRAVDTQKVPSCMGE